MTKNKTRATKTTPASFIKSLNTKEQLEAKTLMKIFEETTRTETVMWGSIFGYGSYHYIYESGREGDFLATGFAMRKSGTTIYIMPGYKNYSDLLKNLGPHKLGRSCLYVKKLSDINTPVLIKLIKAGLKDLKKDYSVKI